jgi:hypothetical protein
VADNSMNESLDLHLNHLFDAELQFRLAAAVRIAVTGQRQPLDFPEVWTHGFVSVNYDEMALRQDQAEMASQLVQHSTTLTMAVVVKDAIEAVVPILAKAIRSKASILTAVSDAVAMSTLKPWRIPDEQVATAYHISRLVRNAYAHAPFAPKWMIHEEIRTSTFSIPSVIRLDTNGLHNSCFDWQHYGGLLALYKLCRFTRFEILGDERHVRTNIPRRQRILYQLGDLIMEQIANVSEEYVPADIQPERDGSIDLGHGYKIAPSLDSESEVK